MELMRDNGETRFLLPLPRGEGGAPKAMRSARGVEVSLYPA